MFFAHKKSVVRKSTSLDNSPKITSHKNCRLLENPHITHISVKSTSSRIINNIYRYLKQKHHKYFIRLPYSSISSHSWQRGDVVHGRRRQSIISPVEPLKLFSHKTMFACDSCDSYHQFEVFIYRFSQICLLFPCRLAASFLSYNFFLT